MQDFFENRWVLIVLVLVVLALLLSSKTSKEGLFFDPNDRRYLSVYNYLDYYSQHPWIYPSCTTPHVSPVNNPCYWYK